MYKRCLALLVTLVFCLSILSGCGNASGDKKEDTAVKETQTAVPSETTESRAAKPVSLKVTGWSITTEKMNPILEQFKKDKPNITVEYSFLLFQDYVNKLKIDFAAGNAPDVADFQVGGMIKPFTNYLEPLAPYAEKAWGSNWKDKFIPLTIRQTEAAGKEFFALPESFSIAGNLFVYKAKLDKYNLQMPKNMDELAAVTNTLKDNKEQGFVIGAKDTWIDFDQFAVMACDVNKDKYYGAIEGKEKWTDPDLMKAFAAWQRLFKDKIVQDGALGVSMYPTVVQENWQKNAVGTFLPCGDWNIEQFLNDGLKDIAEQQKLTVAAFPDVNGDGKPSPVLGTTGVIKGINKNATQEVKTAAWEYIQWFVAEKGIVEMNKLGYYPPAFKEVKVENTMSDTGKACVAAFAELSNNIAGDREIPYPEVSKALGDALQRLAAGQDLNATVEKLQTASERAKRN